MEGRLGSKVMLFIVGSLATVFFQLYNSYLVQSARYFVRNLALVIVFGYLSIQLMRTVSYRPWISNEHQLFTRQNIYEMRLGSGLIHIKNMHFFRGEREIFHDFWGLDVENELKNDLDDLKWDEMPFTVKYEPLINLKISKILLEDNYK